MFSLSNFSFSRSYKLGLTLSGGGAKCLAQVGMLEYFDQHGIKVDVISGASGGALVGTLYALGYAPSQIYDFFKQNKLFNLDSLSFQALGLIKTDRLAQKLAPMMPADNFSSLRIPVYISTTNLNTGKPEVFSKGELLKPLIASCAYPGVFTPVEINGKLYIDGGVTNNFPTDILNNQCKRHIGMYLCPVAEKSNDDFTDAFDVLDRVFEVYSSTQLHERTELLDICLAPNGIEKWGAFNLSKSSLDSLYELGYETTKAFFESNDKDRKAFSNRLLSSKKAIV